MSSYSPEEQEVLAAVAEGYDQRRHAMDIFCYTQTFNGPDDVARILRELFQRGLVARQKNDAGKFCYWKPKGDVGMESVTEKVEEKPVAAAVPVEKKRRGPKPGFKRKAKAASKVEPVAPAPKVAAPAAAREITIQHFRAGLFTDGCLIMDMPGVGRLELTQQETRRIARLFRRRK